MKYSFDLTSFLADLLYTARLCVALHGSTPDQRADIIRAFDGVPR